MTSLTIMDGAILQAQNQVVFNILNKHILTMIWYFTLWIESALLLPKGKATLSQLDNNTSAKIWLFF